MFRRRGKSYRSKTELAREMLERALGLGHLKAGWVAGDDAFGMSPSFREGLAGLGDVRYVLDVPGRALRCGRWSRSLDLSGLSGDGVVPRKPRLSGLGSGGPWGSAATELPAEAWREITSGRGKPGTRAAMMFSAQRVRPTRQA